MKILYISNQRLPTEKAYGLQIAKMCEAFADLGHEVTLLVSTRRNPIKEDIFDYYNVRRNFKLKRVWAPDWYLPGRWDRIAFEIKMPISALTLAGHACREKYDVIYSRDEWPLWFLSFCRRNLYFEAHKFSGYKKFIYQRLKRLKLIVITKALQHEFQQVGFKNILIASDGVDLKEFSLDISKEEARKKTSLPLDKTIVMYTGHFYDWKGVDILIESMRGLSEDYLLVLVGGTKEDLALYGRKIKDEGLASKIFLLGWWPHREIPYFLKAADVLVLPNKAGDPLSEKYTSPLKLFEYMASGRPLVASDLPSLREILGSEHAILIKPNDPRALAEGIKRVMADESLAQKIAAEALRSVQKYSWQSRAKRILAFLNS